MVLGGITFAKVANFDLFEWTQHFNALLVVPLAIPLCMGLIIRKTPKWTPWTAIILLTIVGWSLKFGVDYQALSRYIGWGTLTRVELNDLIVSVVSISGFAVGITYYLVCAKLYKRFPMKEEDAKSVKEFFKDIDTPVLADSNEHKHTDSMQYKKLGSICLAYGSVLFLGFLLPNDLLGRICFIICGLFIGGVGAVLYWHYLKMKKHLTSIGYEAKND